jgi:hypothetical protein
MRQNGRESAYIFGAANPQSGQHVGLMFITCDVSAMSLRPSLIGRALDPQAHAGVDRRLLWLARLEHPRRV